MEAQKIYYNENIFRSKLEAMWAIFFDNLNIPYQYEPCRFEIEGLRKNYLPDFYLPKTYLRDKDIQGVYVEIKHEDFQGDFDHIGDGFPGNIILFCGTPYYNTFQSKDRLRCNSGFEYSKSFTGDLKIDESFWDDNMAMWVCPNCNASKIEFREGNYDNCPVCPQKWGSYKDADAAINAYEIFYSTK